MEKKITDFIQPCMHSFSADVACRSHEDTASESSHDGEDCDLSSDQPKPSPSCHDGADCHCLSWGNKLSSGFCNRDEEEL